jgi:hypothetical protein
MGVQVANHDDEHERWELYLSAIARGGCMPQLQEAIRHEAVPDVALGVVLRVVEHALDEDREQWIDCIMSPSKRRYAEDRVRDLRLLEGLSSVDDAGDVETWSQWLQNSVAVSSTNISILRGLAAKGMTRRIRDVASTRLRAIERSAR